MKPFLCTTGFLSTSSFIHWEILQHLLVALATYIINESITQRLLCRMDARCSDIKIFVGRTTKVSDDKILLEHSKKRCERKGSRYVLKRLNSSVVSHLSSHYGYHYPDCCHCHSVQWNFMLI